MNYAHVFHAGNFGDVAKHIALIACLDALKRKPSAFFALDTHAGAGVYDLRSQEARKSREAESGIQALLPARDSEPSLDAYFSALGINDSANLKSYAGSPALIAAALRAQDRAVFVEANPSVARSLSRQVASSGHVRTQLGDAYEHLKALLPPAERRGLVLIDPCYEEPGEERAVSEQLAHAYTRWATGIYLLWYPIRQARQRNAFHERIRALALPKSLYADLAIHADDASVGLAGSGLILINPPFGVPEFLQTAYDAVHRRLASARGYVEIDWL